MANGQLAQRATSPPKTSYGRRYLSVGCGGALATDRCTEADLREALAQAEAQLLQMAEQIKEQQQELDRLLALHAEAARLVARLTPRQHQVMDMVVAGYPSKNIAADLGISQRSVENHRAA